MSRQTERTVAVSSSQPPSVVGDRYRRTDRLRASNGLEIFGGFDQTDLMPVEITLVPTSAISPATLLRMEHEARVLGSLETGARRIVWSGVDGPWFCWVVPRVEGRCLRDILDYGPLSVEATLRVAASVLRTLEAVHEMHVLHRDVNPANIAIEGDHQVQLAELFNFGLAYAGELDVFTGSGAAQRVRYIAPEVAGLIKVGVDQRSDLYSLGIVLFECLAGHVPFDGASVGEILRRQLNDDPPALRSSGVAVPRALDGVIQRLLSKDPDQRFQSAPSVLHDVMAIMSGLRAGISEPPVTPGLHDRRHVLAEPSFVGRVEELRALTSLVERTGDFGGLVVVEAESGAGKTRLLDELELQAAGQDVWVLRGQGVDRAAPRPFQMIDGIVERIVDEERRAWPGGGLRIELGDRVEAAAAAVPALATHFGLAVGVVAGPEDFGETRSIEALAALLDALGRASRRCLVILDDCQWADAMTLALLARWQSRRGIGDREEPLIVLAFRTEEVGSGHPLRSLERRATVSLRPLSRREIEALCTSMAGPLPADALESIVELADGSPFMSAAVLRGMVETGALRDTAEGWAVDPTLMADVQTSRRAATLVSRRYELMGPEAVRLLTIGAILGKEFDLGVAVALSGQPAAQATAALEEARRRRILWIDELQSRCSFTHDKLREILLDRLDAHERMALHKEAAELIESSDPTRIFELAYHFDQAGEGGRALPYALMAAEEARGRHALDIAATHYRIAERAVNEERVSADDALLVQIAEGFGDVLTLQGHYEEASGYLSEALARTGDGFGRASIDLKLGNIAFKRGDQAQAREYLEEALGELGRRVPRHWLVRIGALVGQTAVQALHTLLPRVFVGRRDAQGHAEEFLAIRIYSRLAYVNWFSTGKTACAWAHLKEMNLAERYGSTPELAQAYSEHAPVMTMLPWFGRGLKYARQSMEIRRDLGDAWGVGQSLNFCGVVLYASTRYREGIESFREAIRLLERTGDRWEMNTAIWNQIFCHYRLGELETAAHMARDLYHSATEIGDVTAAGVSLSGWARADPSTVPEAALAIEMDRDLGDAHTGTEVHLADGIRLLGAGQFSAAAGRIRRASEIAAAAGLRQEYVAPVKPWLATALRMQAESADAHDPKARARLVRQADRAAARAARHARWFRNNRPHALRELALTASLRGRAGRARRHIRSSIEMAEEQSAAYELALSRGVAARLAVARGDQTAASALADAEVERMRLEPRPPLPAHTSVSLADQYEKLLEIGRRIGTASSPAAIYQQVHDAALQLLRGDRCEVVRLARDAGPSEVGGSIDVGPDVMSELIRRALAHRKPVVSDENVHLDSPTFAESRSILCAPITCGDEVVACVVVTHRQVNDLFGDVEVQLMEFVSTLAGAALDHVAGSEARFRSLAQNSSDVITIVDKSGLITYQSAAVEQVFGFRPEDMVGSELAAWIHPDDRDALLVHLDAAASSGTVGSVVQARMRHSDGSWRVGESAVHNLFLDPSVEGLVLNTRDASERVALENELRIRATHDALTGLANRALFVERVDEAFRRTRQKRSATPQEGVAVIFLDLDDFKAINDSLGHFVGDRLLEMTARRLEECVRPGDTVARWGGDEFALLLEWCDSATAESIVMRIITELGRPYRILNQEVLSRASAGVSLSYGQEAASELLVGADLAMYEGKSRGKSRYQFFEPAMRAAAIERSHIRTDLEWVIQRNELSIHYQPIIDLSTGQLKGLEALVRWNHPTRGLMLPESWIGTAEESGMIVPIGSWVIDRACRQLAAWQEAFGEELSVAVNVSARQLQGPALVEEIARILGECGLHPSSLVLEITESATVVDAEAVLGRLRALKSLGVELSIDDFGTGYSSLSYLQRFPVDYLKIDRSFVAEMISSPEDAAIVSWVVNLAHSLRLKVVAEGVESLEQMEALSHIGCDQAQGFVWSKPRPAEDVGKWFDSEWDLA